MLPSTCSLLALKMEAEFHSSHLSRGHKGMLELQANEALVALNM
jgi:hypothetical protein